MTVTVFFMLKLVQVLIIIGIWCFHGILGNLVIHIRVIHDI